MTVSTRTVRVCGTDDVAVGSAARFDVDGHRICVVRLRADDGRDEWYAIDDRCSHADYSLSEGDVWSDEREIECPKHGSTFSLVTGEPQALPATRPVPVYEVGVTDGDVLVTVTERDRDEEQPSDREPGIPVSTRSDRDEEQPSDREPGIPARSERDRDKEQTP